jgi:hypothetical protein
MTDSSLSERDICTKFITPALVEAGWDIQTQIREEVSFTAGRIQVRGRIISRGARKRVDYILYYKNNLPLAYNKIKFPRIDCKVIPKKIGKSIPIKSFPIFIPMNKGRKSESPINICKKLITQFLSNVNKYLSEF